MKFIDVLHVLMAAALLVDVVASRKDDDYDCNDDGWKQWKGNHDKKYDSAENEGNRFTITSR